MPGRGLKWSGFTSLPFDTAVSWKITKHCKADDMYQLYGDFGSGSCTVELTLAELGVDYTTHNVDLGANAQRDTSYERVNPQRKLPSLHCPDGRVMTESVAILLTLLENHPGHQLLPAIGTGERAIALRWLLFAATELYPIVEIVDYPERFSVDPKNAESTRELARSIWRRRWLIVEENVAGPFVLGDSFSVSDIYLAVVSRWAQQETWRPANIPNIETLTSKVAARPKCASIWNQHFPSG